MAKFGRDQAEGLRQLLAKNFVRIVTLTSSKEGVGRTSAVINLATALAKTGKDVLVLDENLGQGNLNAALGLKARYDLLHVIRRDKSLEEVVLPGPGGISVLPAARGLKALSRLSPAEQQWVVECFSSLARPVDIVLVDAAAGSASSVLPLGLAAQEIVLVLSGATSSITDNYALIKLLNQEYAKRHFRILVNKVRTEEEAMVIFNNMAQVAQRYLSVSLDFMGFVLHDGKLKRSTQLLRPVVEVFPAAASAACFRRLADELVQWPAPRDESGKLENFMQHLMQSGRISTANMGL